MGGYSGWTRRIATASHSQPVRWRRPPPVTIGDLFVPEMVRLADFYLFTPDIIQLNANQGLHYFVRN